MKPVVSIVLPVFNAAASLPQTLASILDQSCKAFQLIAVDDGSTDDSLGILLEWAAKDQRIQIVSQPNAGVSAARNFGVGMARAPFVAFMDADDLWHREKLSAHLCHHARCPQMDASFASVAFLPADAKSLNEARTHSKVPLNDLRLRDVLAENPVCTTSNLFIRTARFLALGGFKSGLTHAEDQEFLARLVNSGSLVFALDKVLVGYRLSEDGLSMDLEAMYRGWQSFAGEYLEPEEYAALDALYLRYLARRTLRAAGPPRQSFEYTLAGLKADRRSFLADPYRGYSTVAASLIAAVTPSTLRRRLFA